MRAGLISRISGITFEKFKNELLKPLERVVKIHEDVISRDFVYQTRHPLIARFVFEQALPRPEERQDQIVRILKYLNVDYKWDEDAFTYLIRGKELAELFADRSLSDQIYEISENIGASKSHIYHQRAIFEINHPSGQTIKALELIDRAINESSFESKSILHTKAMIFRKMAKDSDNDLQKQKYRNDAEKILEKQLSHSTEGYPYSGLAQLIIDEIRDKSQEIDPENLLQNRIVTSLISKVEQVISDGLQKYPIDEFLLSQHADIAQIINDQPKVLLALESAFNNNPRSDYLATRIAKQYLKKNKQAEAINILTKCLEHNTGSKKAHISLARVYIDFGEK